MICLCAVQSVVRGTVFLQQKPKPAEQRCLPCMAKYYQQKRLFVNSRTMWTSRISYPTFFTDFTHEKRHSEPILLIDIISTLGFVTIAQQKFCA